MEEYIVYYFGSNTLNRFFTNDISTYENQSNYKIINTTSILSHPIGCCFKYENNSNVFIYESNLSLQEQQLYIKYIRDERDKILKATDYLMLEDVRFEYKSQLQIYRQYLRELPNKINGNLYDYYHIDNKRLYIIDKFEYYDLNKLIKD